VITVKAHGLCFYCGDKFDAGHIDKCTKRPKAHVNALVANDLDHNLTDEILDQLAVEDSLNEEFCQLSLNALARTDCGQAMKIAAHVKNKVMLILVGSSWWIVGVLTVLSAQPLFRLWGYLPLLWQPNRLSWLMEPP